MGTVLTWLSIDRLSKQRIKYPPLLLLLQVALQQRSDPVVLAELMPRHWSDFVRNAPMDQVKPLGTR